MTKAKEIFEIDSSANALDWAAAVLRLRFEQVFALRDGALKAEDIEGVHEMRVAIRRLRSALRDFSTLLKSPLLKKSKKELKQLADMLGKARDNDVAIIALKKLRDNSKKKTIQNNLEKKIEKRQVHRNNTQNKLVKILDPTSLKRLREHFVKSIDEAIEKGGKFSELTAKEMGREVITKSLQEFCSLSESLYSPFNQTKLHELRISAKRLRYAIELFNICWGKEIQPFAKEMSEMQTYLGELHDSDIWIENLNKQLVRKKGKRQITEFWLLSKFTQKRTKNYRASLRLWSKWQKNKFIINLQEFLQRD